MPYIQSQERSALDNIVDDLVEQLSIDGRAGDLNYVISNILVKSLFGIESYKLHNENIGVLESVKLEYYRRKVAPYEDKKINDNGDIEVYK